MKLRSLLLSVAVAGAGIVPVAGVLDAHPAGAIGLGGLCSVCNGLVGVVTGGTVSTDGQNSSAPFATVSLGSLGAVVTGTAAITNGTQLSLNGPQVGWLYFGSVTTTPLGSVFSGSDVYGDQATEILITSGNTVVAGVLQAEFPTPAQLGE